MRSDTAFAFQDKGSTTASTVLAGAKVLDDAGLYVRGALVHHAPSSKANDARVVASNPMLFGIWSPKLAPSLRLPLFAGLAFPVGTGSGNVVIALARHMEQATFFATDISPAALAVARANAAALGLADRIDFREGDLLQPVADRAPFDIIVSNPPYIADGDPHLGRGDLRFEPPTALSSGADGLDAIREIVATAPAHLLPGGWLLLEHGWDQGAAIRELLLAAGFVEVGVSHLQFETPVADADTLWRGVLDSAVRIPPLVTEQPAEVQARIRAAFDELVAVHRREAGTLAIPVSVQVTQGRRS